MLVSTRLAIYAICAWVSPARSDGDTKQEALVKVNSRLSLRLITGQEWFSKPKVSYRKHKILGPHLRLSPTVVYSSWVLSYSLTTG